MSRHSTTFAMNAPQRRLLTLLVDGKPVGRVRVERTYIDKVFGTLLPGPGFDTVRDVFEAAVEQSRRIDALSDTGPVETQARDRLMAAYVAIQRLQPAFAELPQPIEEFAIEADWSVEVTFVESTRH
jgi:hypothetical protein